MHIFHQLVREANEEDPDNGQVLTYDYFKKALIRFSCIGHEKLGGQVAANYEKKQEENKVKDDALQKTKSSIAQRNTVTKKIDKKETLKEEEEDPEEISPKKQGRQDGTLAERGAKQPREKIIPVNPKEEKLKNATLLKGKFDDEMLLNKKSSNINQLYEIDQKARALGSLSKVKVDDSRVTTE